MKDTTTTGNIATYGSWCNKKGSICEFATELGYCPITACKYLPVNFETTYYKDPQGVVEIVEKWSKEHPAKTNRDKFFEVFGIDPRPAGYVPNHNRAEGLATEWWDRPYEEPKEE